MCTAFLFLAAAASEAGGGGSVASTSGGDASASGGGRGSAAAAAASLSLLLAFSRDEYLQRSTAPLHAWADADVVGGRDLQRRGTWLGASRSGRVAFLTNRIAPGSPPFVTAPAAPSRGALVPSALASTDPPLDFLGRAMRDSPPHLGYNLVLADVGRREAAFASNADAGGGGPTLLSPGVHGIANVGLEEGGALPKVRRGTAALAQILEGAAAAAEEAEEELDLDASILRAEAAALRSRLGGAHDGAALRARGGGGGGYALLAQIDAALALLERRLAPDAPSLGSGGARGVLLELHALDELTSCASSGRPPADGAAAERWAAMQAAAACAGASDYSEDEEEDGGGYSDDGYGDEYGGGGHKTPGRRPAPRSRGRRR